MRHLHKAVSGQRSWFPVPVHLFIRQIKQGAARDFLRVVEQVQKVLGANPLVMTLPIGREEGFSGVVDILTKKAHIWDDSGLPENFEITDVPADMVDEVEMYHEQMIETALEADEDLLMEYLEGELTPTEEQIKAQYDKLAKELKDKEEYKISHILVKSYAKYYKYLSNCKFNFYLTLFIFNLYLF